MTSQFENAEGEKMGRGGDWNRERKLMDDGRLKSRIENAVEERIW